MVNFIILMYIIKVDEIDLEYIRNLCKNKKIYWSMHIVTRLLQRGILQDDVENAIMTGEIIEQYPDDYPNPSCLVLGLTINKEKLHVVCGLNKDTLYMITAYFPDLTIWNSDLKTRRKGGFRK